MLALSIIYGRRHNESDRRESSGIDAVLNALVNGVSLRKRGIHGAKMCEGEIWGSLVYGEPRSHRAMITVEESHRRNVAPTTKFSCLHTYGKVDQLPHPGAAHFGIPSPYNQFLPLLGGVLSFGLFTRSMLLN